jgi:hypothetical protein
MASSFNPKDLGIPETEAEADAINEQFEIQTLTQIVQRYNQAHDDFTKIDLNRVKTKTELLISLYQREIKEDIPETIGFGQPYDDVFHGFSQGDDAYSLPQTEEDEDPDYAPNPIDQSPLYKMLINPEVMVGFLGAAISPVDYKFNALKHNVFTVLKKPLPTSYRHFQELLATLSDIDLAYIAIRCSNLVLYNSRQLNLYRDGITLQEFLKGVFNITTSNVLDIE